MAQLIKVLSILYQTDQTIWYIGRFSSENTFCIDELAQNLVSSIHIENSRKNFKHVNSSLIVFYYKHR